MKNQRARGIAFLVLGIALTVIFRERTLGLISAVIFILLGSVLLIKSRPTRT